jgi:hypothetical protein
VEKVVKTAIIAAPIVVRSSDVERDRAAKGLAELSLPIMHYTCFVQDLLR